MASEVEELREMVARLMARVEVLETKHVPPSPVPPTPPSAKKERRLNIPPFDERDSLEMHISRMDNLVSRIRRGLGIRGPDVVDYELYCQPVEGLSRSGVQFRARMVKAWKERCEMKLEPERYEEDWEKVLKVIVGGDGEAVAVAGCGQEEEEEED